MSNLNKMSFLDYSQIDVDRLPQSDNVYEK